MRGQYIRRCILLIFISLAMSLVVLLSQEPDEYYGEFSSYYTTLEDVTNVVTSGEVSIHITERSSESKWSGSEYYVNPGSVVSKTFSVENDGKHPCWLRISLSKAISDKSLSADIIELDINKEDWLYSKDGYYYYKTILQPGEETEPVISKIKVSESADNSYLGKNLLLTVTAFAVQSENNDKASSPFDAVGWPAEY